MKAESVNPLTTVEGTPGLIVKGKFVSPLTVESEGMVIFLHKHILTCIFQASLLANSDVVDGPMY